MRASFDLVEPVVHESPYRYIEVPKVFDEPTCEGLYQWLRTSDDWYSSSEEYHSFEEMRLLPEMVPPEFGDLLFGSGFAKIRDYYSDAFGIEFKNTIDILAHRYTESSFIKVHNDAGVDGPVVRMNVYLTPYLSPEDGGHFCVHEGDHSVNRQIPPLANTSIGFEISSDSWHSVTSLRLSARYSITYTFWKK